MKTEKQVVLTNKSHSRAETLTDLPVDEAGQDEVKGGPTYGRGQYHLFLDDGPII